MPGLRRSFAWALRGLRIGLRERNFRIHLTAVFYVTAAGLLAGLSRTQMSVLCLCFGLVTALELVNTAVETLCDRVTARRDRLIRDAKDLAAGAVLLSALFSTVVALLLFADVQAVHTIFETISRHLWIGVLLLLSIPASVGFIFAIEQKGEPK